MSFVRPYNPAVRVANWNEDIALEQVCSILCLSVCGPP